MKRLSFIRPLTFFCLTVLISSAHARERLQFLSPSMYRSLASEIDESEIERTIRSLSKFHSRVSGYPGERHAARFVQEKMRDLDLSEPQEYRHFATVPVVESANLRVAGKDFAVHPLWPNLVRTSQLPSKGLDAELIYGGTGRLDEFNGYDMGIDLSDQPHLNRGPIVLMDFNCSTNWFNAVLLGARAIIFVEPEETIRGEGEAKFLTTPINIPRFWIDRASASQLISRIRSSSLGSGGRKGVAANLQCRMQWKKREIRSFTGMIPGTGVVPVRDRPGETHVDSKVKDEIVILHAYYDSMSIVPELAPGAEQACGLATMLEIARVLKKHPPARTVMILATSGHCQTLSDVRAFFHRLTNPQLPWETLDKNRKWLDRVTCWMSFEITSGTSAAGTFFKGHFIDQSESVLQSRFSDIGTLGREVSKKALEARRILPHELTKERTRELAARLQAGNVEDTYRNFADGVSDKYRPDIRTRFDEAIKKINEDRSKANPPWDKDKWEDQTSTALNGVREAQFDKYYADCINPIKGKSWGTYLPGGRFAFSSEIATLAAKPGIAFVTIDDGRERVDTPFDTADRVNLDNVVTQARLLACVIPEMLRARTDTYPRQLDDIFARVTGKLVQFLPEKSYMPDVPVPGALAVARSAQGSNKSFTGVRGEWIELVDGKDAHFEFPGMPSQKARTLTWRFEGFGADKETGEINFAPDIHWILDFPNEMQINLNDKEIRVVLFDCVSTSIFDMVDQRMFRLLGEMYVYDAESDSEPIYFGRSLPFPQPGVSFYEPAAVIYGKKDAKSKVTMGASVFGLRFTLLNTDREKYMKLRAAGKHPDPYDQEVVLGRGYEIAKWPRIPMTPHRVARDMWILDDDRIRFFAEHAIRNDRVERLHNLGKDFLDEADRQLKARDYDKYVTSVRKAWSYESKAYPDVQGTASDVVRGVLFYLFLLLPFTYAAERLFVASRNIQVRIISSAIIFITFFLGLRYTHPAFDILTVPSVVVLLAFVMLALTVAVVSIITQKFEDQMRQIKFETGGVHSADVGRLGASAAAFSLGISNMRRRRARTALTCSTLILLTFTVLSFTSVKSGDRINKILLGPSIFNAESFAIVVSPLLLRVLQVSFVLLTIAAIVISSRILREEGQKRHFADTAEEEEYKEANWKKKARTYALYGVPTILTIMTFWSFSSMLRTTPPERSTARTYKPPYNGIQIRDRAWTPLGEPMARIVDAEYRGKYPVAPRAWYYSTLVGQKSFVTVQYGTRLYQASAVVGMRAAEKDVTHIDRALLPGSRWFNEKEMFACVVPSDVAETIGIKKEDVRNASITLFGVPLRIVGIIDSEQLKPGPNKEHATIRDVDTEPLTPVDYVLMQERRQQSEQPVSQGELEEYIHLAPREVIFVPYDFVIAHGGNLRSIAINFGDGPQGAKLADRELNTLMERVELNLFAGIGEETYLVSAVASTSIQNVHNVFIPILIAALIVFNTMLGAVYERVREIGIFGSLGLAPVHIASLFLAEAFVYAVLGAISGYLIGQFGAKMLFESSLFQGLNLNYSSMSAVGTTLIVMAVVVLSTLYPARMASRLSVPGVERRWKLPPPDGDYLRLPLPFTVSSGQTLGLNMYLKEYMEAHADYSLGHFSVDSVALTPLPTSPSSDGEGAANGSGARGWRLEAMVWLAPYDLGVSEYLILETVPTDDEFVNEVLITIRRESGDESSWMRVTRNFLNMIRKQFLLWRTFKPEVKEQYEQQGRDLIHEKVAAPV